MSDNDSSNPQELEQTPPTAEKTPLNREQAPPTPEQTPLAPEPQPQGSWPEPLQPRRPPRSRPIVNLVLFTLTLGTTVYWGFLEYQNFYQADLRSMTLNPFQAPDRLIGGLPFALAVIAFLLAHEMGHYLACRFYGIRATLPYFIPMPPFLPVPAPPFLIRTLLPGTMGAVIRIVSPISTRRALFDIAVAGPLAGFLVALPILAVGLSQSRVVGIAELELGGSYITMGEPLIWGPMASAFGPPMTPAQDLIVHPLAFVGWFALLVTAMNLLPVGQLDGGHILYAFVPRGHRLVSLAVLLLMLMAGFVFFPGWVLFAFVVFFFLGTRHPKPLQFDEPLGGVRVLIAVLALLVFVSSFILVPVQLPSMLR